MTEPVDWAEVAQRVQALKAACRDTFGKQTTPKVFGSQAHRFELAPTLTEQELDEAETQWGGRLPEEYRAFVLNAGAGGAGPAYGLFPLSKTRVGWNWVGDGGELTTDLGTAWKHENLWNLEGDPLWDQRPDGDDRRLDPDAFDDAYEAWAERFEKLYWDPSVTAGGICICHEGCALRDWLVVAGPTRGSIWHDARVDRSGLVPTLDRDGHTIQFGAWYLKWLEAAEHTVFGATKNHGRHL